jgi:protein-S-isoprenylcysteine O-methyltransferase Ste14
MPLLWFFRLLGRVLPPRGREARPAPAWWIVLKTLAHMASFTTVFFGVIPLTLAEIEKRTPLGRARFFRPWLKATALILFALFLALAVWSSLAMALAGRGTMLPVDCAPALVERGPYKWVRNPMVIAGLGQGAAVALAHGSPLCVLYILCGALVRHLLLEPWEEADLEARFGEPWREYRARVPGWIPRRPGQK